MKKSKMILKPLVSILVVAMLFSSIVVPTAAESSTSLENPFEKYTLGSGYVAIGDGITRGYGTGNDAIADAFSKGTNSNCRNVPYSFPSVISQYLGLNAPDNYFSQSNYWPIAQKGMTVSYFNDLLGIEDNYTDLEYDHGVMKKQYETILAGFGDKDSFCNDGTSKYGKNGDVASIKELVNNASLITIELGTADIFYKAYKSSGFASYEHTIDEIEFWFQFYEVIEQTIKDISQFKDQYAKLLDYIKKNNSDCTVVLVGAINPYQDIVIYEGCALPIASKLNLLADLLNTFYREMAEEYGYLFVDISAVDTIFSENAAGLEAIIFYQGYLGYPSTTGYMQIANAIMYELSKCLGAYTTDTTIVINLGRMMYWKQLCVYVNGKKLDNEYYVNSYTSDLFIYYPTKNAINVTITGQYIDEQYGNDYLQITSYNLRYDAEKGYIAKKIYTNNKFMYAEKSLLLLIVDLIYSSKTTLASKQPFVSATKIEETAIVEKQEVVATKETEKVVEVVTEEKTIIEEVVSDFVEEQVKPFVEEEPQVIIDDIKEVIEEIEEFKEKEIDEIEIIEIDEETAKGFIETVISFPEEYIKPFIEETVIPAIEETFNNIKSLFSK